MRVLSWCLLTTGLVIARTSCCEEIAAVDSRVLVVKLRRNFGQTSALAAGFDHAQGEFILAMDGDLQHEPEEIPDVSRQA